MFTIRKLQQLPYNTRLRKIVLILQQSELEIKRGMNIDADYLMKLLDLLVREARLGQATQRSLKVLGQRLQEGSLDILRLTNRARHALLGEMGLEPAEWDLFTRADGPLDPGARRVLPYTVYLEEIRSPFNVGAIFRSAEAFGVEKIFISPNTPSPEHPRALKTARGTTALIPWAYAGLEASAGAGGLFALELGGTSLEAFNFPTSGMMLVGSEELGLSPEALKAADNSAGRVSIPMAGVKRSLNVAVAVGIVLQSWFAAGSDIESGI